MMKGVTITPNMAKKDIDKAVSFLIGNDSKCSMCGSINLMSGHTCFDCTLKASECTECGKTCHADQGGIYEKCETCLSKENRSNIDGSEHSQECN